MIAETLDQAEACELLDCTPETLAEELRTGGLPGTKVGRSWVIPRAAFFQRLNERALEEAKERREKRSAPPKPPTPQPAGARRAGSRRRPLPIIPDAARSTQA